MPSPDGSFNLSGRVYGGSATSIGNLMVADGTGFYVVATAANRATFGRAQAIATSNWGGAQSGAVSLQFVGTCDSNLPNVGVGAAGRWVRCSTAGAFEVFTPTNGGSSDVVGCTNAAGVVTMLFGVLTETMLVAAGTPPGGASGAVQVNNAGAFAGVSPGSNGQVLTVVSGAWASAPSSGGGTTPTGTGLRKVVAGVENAAASLIVDADVTSVGASKITGTLPVASGGTGAGSFTSGELCVGAGTGPIVTAAGVKASAGQIGDVTLALTVTGTTFVLKGTSTTSLLDGSAQMMYSNGSQLGVGCDLGLGGQHSLLYLYATAIRIGCGAQTFVYLDSTVAYWGFTKPVGGGSAFNANMPLQWKTGDLTAVAGVNTLTSDQNSSPMINITGSPGAGFSVIAALAKGAGFDVWNGTTQTCTFGGATGANVSIPANTKVRVICPDGANYR